ncbi:MAG: T9SS type A sorting domain-containing protein [Salibacteraceae bacterium]|nr:T9SS type A sorting domain-containing protein [Salibacteraceae bacterium]
MKKLLLLLAFIPGQLCAQFDFYGPAPFQSILTQNINANWTPTAISNIENRKYVVILDEQTKTKAIMLDAGNKSLLKMRSVDSISGNQATFGSAMRSVFQMVDKNSAFENASSGGSGTYTPLSNTYKLNPLLHSYYHINSNGSNEAINTDGGTYYIYEETNTGYLIVEFVGSANATKIKAVSKWQYDATSEEVIEVSNYTAQYLQMSGENLTWNTNAANASTFFLADANDFLNIEIAMGSDFNPSGITYQTNATAALPNVSSMENSQLNNIAMDLDANYVGQLGNSTSATTSATAMLDQIEADLTSRNAALRYPKSFYLALRENMLSHTIDATDIYNIRLGNNNVHSVYFTNSFDDQLVPHPFMVMACYAVSSRPNFLQDVNRPPGGSGGPGYGESQVTRNGKFGEFLIKIPLKDYGLISTLLENDLSEYNDLASDYDLTSPTGGTTTKDVYNYASINSIAVAVDGVTIYPGQNNTLVFAVEAAEVTSSGIHVGGGLELHYHADGHAYNGNGFNLYNLADYDGNNHPPVIGIAFDGIALFGKYETSYSSMAGYNISLDEYGGHDHGDGFGYHYHAHTQSMTTSMPPSVNFDEHFLMVGAWKGNINSIPGFLELKGNQLKEADIARYAGASYTIGIDDKLEKNTELLLFPNPAKETVNMSVSSEMKVRIYDIKGSLINTYTLQKGANSISIKNYTSGTYIVKSEDERIQEKLIIQNP